jgi:hypothetical protein
MELRMPDGFLPWEGFILKPGAARRKKLGKVYHINDFVENQEPIIGVDEGAAYWRLRPYDLIARVEDGYVLGLGRTRSSWPYGWFVCKKVSGYLGVSIPFSGVCRKLAKSLYLEIDEWCITRCYSEDRVQLRTFLTDDSIGEIEADFSMRYRYQKRWHEANVEYLFRSNGEIYAVQCTPKGDISIVRIDRHANIISKDVVIK